MSMDTSMAAADKSVIYNYMNSVAKWGGALNSVISNDLFAVQDSGNLL